MKKTMVLMAAMCLCLGFMACDENGGGGGPSFERVDVCDDLSSDKLDMVLDYYNASLDENGEAYIDVGPVWYEITELESGDLVGCICHEEKTTNNPVLDGILNLY